MCVCGGAVRERVLKREFEEALKRARLEWGLGGEATGRLGASEVRAGCPRVLRDRGRRHYTNEAFGGYLISDSRDSVYN